MKKTLAFLVALIITMAISTVVYANAVVTINNAHSDVTYAANYFSETPPPVWYNLTYLGIVEVINLNGTAVRINVDLEKVPSELSPLQSTQPIFKYDEKYYKVSSHWEDPELPSKLRGWEVPVGGGVSAGWIVTGLVFVHLRKRREQK